jgi:hypothetical protein
MVVDVLEEWGKMIDAIDMMVSIIDEDFNLVKINRKMKEFFGEAEMKKCYKVFHNLDSPPETCRILAFLRGIKKGKEYIMKNFITGGLKPVLMKYILVVKDSFSMLSMT